jgi:hypothetical protein
MGAQRRRFEADISLLSGRRCRPTLVLWEIDHSLRILMVLASGAVAGAISYLFEIRVAPKWGEWAVGVGFLIFVVGFMIYAQHITRD